MEEKNLEKFIDQSKNMMKSKLREYHAKRDYEKSVCQIWMRR